MYLNCYNLMMTKKEIITFFKRHKGKFVEDEQVIADSNEKLSYINTKIKHIKSKVEKEKELEPRKLLRLNILWLEYAKVFYNL